MTRAESRKSSAILGLYILAVGLVVAPLAHAYAHEGGARHRPEGGAHSHQDGSTHSHHEPEEKGSGERDKPHGDAPRGSEHSHAAGALEHGQGVWRSSTHGFVALNLGRGFAPIGYARYAAPDVGPRVAPEMPQGP